MRGLGVSLPSCHLLEKGVCIARGNTADFLSALSTVLQAGQAAPSLPWAAVHIPQLQMEDKPMSGSNESLQDFFHMLLGSSNRFTRSSDLRRASWLPPVQDCCKHCPNHLACSRASQPCTESPCLTVSAAASRAGKVRCHVNNKVNVCPRERSTSRPSLGQATTTQEPSHCDALKCYKVSYSSRSGSGSGAEIHAVVRKHPSL